MDFFFPEQNPEVKRLPPDQVRILELKAEPYPDGGRVRVNLEVTPFQRRPQLEVTLEDPGGEEVSTVSIVEPMSWRLEFTMHLRGQKTTGKYSLLARLFYPKPLDLPAQGSLGDDPDAGPPSERPALSHRAKIAEVPGEGLPDTDRRQLTFEMP